MTATESAPTAPPPAQGVPFVSDLLRIIRAMFSPGAVFEELTPKPRVLWPWLAFSALVLIPSVLMMPFNAKMQRVAIEAAGQTVPASMDMWLKVGTFVGVPLTMLLIAAVSSLILWVTVSIMGGDGRFKQAMSITLHSWGPIFLQQLAMAIVLKMRGLDSIRNRQDMMVPLGADLLLPPETTGFVRGLAGGINPFSIWCIVIVAVGLQVMLKMKPSSAWTVAIISGLVGIMISAVFAGFATR